MSPTACEAYMPKKSEPEPAKGPMVTVKVSAQCHRLARQIAALTNEKLEDVFTNALLTPLKTRLKKLLAENQLED